MTRVYFYDAKGHDQTVELSPSLVARTGKQQLIWIDLLRSDEAAVREAAAILKLGDDLTEALLDHPAEPVLESFAGHFHLALPISPNAGKAKDCVTYVVAERWLLTVRDGDIPYFREFRDQDNGETLSGRLTPAALAAALLDWHLEDYQAEITDIQTNADKIDQDVLLAREEEPPLRVLAKLQARLADLRRKLGEHRRIIHGLLRADFAHIAGHPHAEYYEALERHFDRTDDSLDRTREMIVGSFDLYATRTAQETNQLVKLLTLVTVIIGFSGAIAGIFGMNFDTPITKTGLPGFIVTVSSMIVLGALLTIFAWRRKWLS
jgi:Mg2+ and Co2+ transporter CorA